MTIVFPGALGLRFRPARARLVVHRGSLFVLGPPLGPKVNLKNFPGPPFGPSFALEHTPRTLSRPSKKRSGPKNEIVEICTGFPSEFVPWPTFAAPGRSKRTPMGPDQLSRGPPGKPLERSKAHRAQFENKHVFEKIAKPL